MPEVSSSKYLVNAGWDDVPHLPEDVKEGLLSETPEFLRDARTKGIPSLGSGAIYPIQESLITCQPFKVPDYWPRAFALDVGWNKTACIWGALDRDTGTTYLYAEHYRGKVEPVIHASAIKARGDWIPGVIDPASRGRQQGDGQRLMIQYQQEGLDIKPSENSVEAGLLAVWQALSNGTLKVFTSLLNFLAEYRLYRRDEKGAIVKEFDHLMDALRYLILSGMKRAKTKPVTAIGPGSIGGAVADNVGGY